MGTAIGSVLVVAVGASASGSRSAAAIPDFSVSQLNAPAGANWISENGNIQSWRYSTLNQITGANGGSLKLAWDTHLANPTTAEKISSGNANPIVYNGTMYVQDASSAVIRVHASCTYIVPL